MNPDYINFFYEGLPLKTKAVTVDNKDGGYTVVVNKNLSYDLQYQGIKHELWHIVHEDFERENVNDIERDAHAS